MALIFGAGVAFGSGTEEATERTQAVAASTSAFVGTGEPLQYATPAAYRAATGLEVGQYSQAPGLATKVAAGTLPDVGGRLPMEPAVMAPTEEVGTYGGTWERVFLGPSDMTGVGRILSDSLIRWSPDTRSIIPNIAKAWQVTDNGQVVSFELREGMKWSDGSPYSADDLMFWFEDVALNKDLGSLPSWMRVRGLPGTLEKIDDTTVRMVFPQPYGYIVRMLAYRGNGISYPKHYLTQFHPAYADADALNRATAEAGFDEWFQLFKAREQLWQNPDRPVISAWMPLTDRSVTRYVLERNPYYWKVDVAGNQLPYIDRIAFDLVEAGEVTNLRAMGGEIDMQFRHIDISDFTLLMNSRQEGDYRILRWTPASGADPMILPNLDQRDPVLRELLRTTDFRRALSVAINRDEINQIVYLGLGVPRQATVIEQSVYFKPEFATAYAQYDPDTANRLLDGIGLTQRGGDGYRLRPDGATLSLTIDTPGGLFGPWEDVAGLVAEYWDDVGIKTSINAIDRSLFVSRSRTDEFEIGVWNMDSALDFLLRARYWIPQSSVTFAPLGYAWMRSDGEKGLAPPDPVQRVIELYDQALATPDDAVRLELAHEILEIHADQVYVIGTVGMVPDIGVVKNNFRNVPENAVSDYTVHTPGNAQPSQYFIRQ